MFVRGDQSSAFPPEDRDAPDPRPSDASPAAAAPDAAADPATHSTDFVHQLRNRLFAMSALFDVLELRGAGTPVVDRYLPHLRLELSRLEEFAEDWTEDSLVEAPATPPTLTDVLAAAIQRVSESAALRDVLLSLVSAPDSGRLVHHPALVTAAFALLLDEVLRGVPAGSHVWFAVSRSARGEVTVELHATHAEPLAGTGLELARAALRALGGDLLPGGAESPPAVVVARLGASA